MRGGERRLVLRGGNGDAERAATISRCKRGTDDGEVVGFRATGGEHDLVRLGADGVGDGALGLFDSGARRPPETVRRGGITEGFVPEIGKHGLQDLRSHRGRRRVIEIRDALGHGRSQFRD